MTTTLIIRRNLAAEAYWKSVKHCIAKTDGSAEIHHHDGRVEYIGADGRRLRVGREMLLPEAKGAGNKTCLATGFTRAAAMLRCASVALTLGVALFASNGNAEEAEKVPAASGLVAAIIDDQTGEELARDHGIQPLVLGDLVELIKGVLEGDKPTTLVHLAVDDDAGDNPVGRLTFAPFVGGKPPRAPSPTLPLRVLSVEVEKYRRARAEWQSNIMAYRQKVVEEAGGFIRQVAATQMQVAERFDDLLELRGGRDFNRSDCVGAITIANKLLGNQGRRVLILNTDAKDLPAKRAPRKTPLTADELAADVELIFVNTSHLPQQSPLFRDIPNKIHSVPSMKAAFALLVEMLGQDDQAQDAPDQASADPR